MDFMMANKEIHLFGFSGSLRKHSLNTILLKSAQDVLPKDVSLNIFNLGHLPLYNDDIADKNSPDSVLTFRENVKNADGILIASPEYNYSITGVLKNAIDWATTNTLGNVLEGKKIAIMGASRTIFGTVRSQLHLRQVLLAANADVVRRPEVFVRRMQTLIDDDNKLIDERTLGKIKAVVCALLEALEISG